MNIDILMKAMRNQEPLGVISRNAVKKFFDKTGNAYYPKFRLSRNRVYNEYLNRRKDYYESIIQDVFDTNDASDSTLFVEEFRINIIIYGGHVGQVVESIHSVETYQASSVRFIMVDGPRNIKIDEEEEFKDLNIISLDLEELENIRIYDSEYYMILSAGQLLEKYALLNFRKHLAENSNSDLITFDSDEIKEKLRMSPKFRPHNNKLFLYNYNYIENAFLIRGHLFKSLISHLVINEYLDSYGLLLRAFDLCQSPSRITEVLISSTHEPQDNRRNHFDILDKFFETDNSIQDIVPGIAKGTFRVKNKLIKKPKVSIIIPFKNQGHLLRDCLNSIFKTVVDVDYEIILADNGSTDKSLLKYVKQIEESYDHIRHFVIDIPFNFSRINNEATKLVTGDYILFLNNDIEAIKKGWLEDMMEYLQQEDVGIIGAKLLYGNGRVQHAGVILGVGHVAGHAFRHLKDESDGNLKKANCIQEIGSVTGACLLIKKECFIEVGGFNEKDLAIAYNDIDLCLKVREAGYKIIYTPYAKLYHHESQSRSHDMSKSEIERYQSEVKYMQDHWSNYLEDDPYHHPILSGLHESYEQFTSKY